MPSTSRAACPNCGRELDLPASAFKLVCKHCDEAIRVAPDGRLFLLNPISRYSELGETEDTLSAPPPEQLALSRNEKRRRTFSAELGFDRIAQQKREAARFFRIGAGLLFVALLFLLVMLARAWIIGIAFPDVVLPGVLILALIIFGIYFVIWSIIVTRSSSKEEQELRKELSILKGKVANDS